MSNNYDEIVASLHGKEISGEKFNELFSDRQFVKLTNKTENHNDYQFSDGLNIDIKPFDPRGECRVGGNYFTIIEKAYMWISYGLCVMRYIRKVTIPDDARV